MALTTARIVRNKNVLFLIVILPYKVRGIPFIIRVLNLFNFPSADGKFNKVKYVSVLPKVTLETLLLLRRLVIYK